MFTHTYTMSNEAIDFGMSTVSPHSSVTLTDESRIAIRLKDIAKTALRNYLCVAKRTKRAKCHASIRRIKVTPASSVEHHPQPRSVSAYVSESASDMHNSVIHVQYVQYSAER